MWITHPNAPIREPLVLHFRRSLHLDTAPSTFPVRVSADNRFVLYVNEQRAGDGPARGDLNHWRYEQFDLAPMLHSGENLITAVVWNYGVYAPIAQISDRCGFLLEGEGSAGVADTGQDWQVSVEPGQTALPREPDGFHAYFAVGAGDRLDASKFDWDWRSGKSRAQWVPAASPMRENNDPHAARGRNYDETSDTPWGLVPDELPHMTYTETAAGHVVRDTLGSSSGFPGSAITIPANTNAEVLLDRTTLITAYPSLSVSGGKGSRIKLVYAEGLFDEKFQKGDRNDVGKRKTLGNSDELLPDGGHARVFETLWWRTWRYLDLQIKTGDESLTLESLTAHATRYPFEERAAFDSPDPELKQIWDISWRTAQLDAHETYMDTPYYEQLQYIGDTRIQALISYAVANDDRLARQALRAFDQSRLPEGITASRYPTAQPQIIPTFSLLWIGMIHDYWMYRQDTNLVRDLLPGARAVLAWYARHEADDHLLRELPWWCFIDWTQGDRKLPSYGASGESCVTSLQYLGALDQAADLEKAVGDPDWAQRNRARAETLRHALYQRCWDAGTGLMADTPEKGAFSQQANVLAVLHDVIPQAGQRAVMERMVKVEPIQQPGPITASSLYFRFYLARALDHAGMADQYLPSLQPWRTLLPLHFSTWPETMVDTRSDSHAWSAHPIFDMLTLIAGVEPATPGFRTVRIAPHLGSLTSLKASYPHPSGTIQMEYAAKSGGLDAQITLPPGLTGTFVWHGQERPLQSGENHLQLQ